MPIVIGALRTLPQVLEKELKDLEIREGAVTIIVKSTRLLRRVLERWSDLLSLSLEWKTIKKCWCEKIAFSKIMITTAIIIIIIIKVAVVF